MKEIIKDSKDKNNYFKSEKICNIISKKVNEEEVLKSLKFF